jgi:hypothetical protein
MPDGRASRRSFRDNLPTYAAAGIPAIAYIVYVWCYSFNIPFADDWTKLPMTVRALHGALGFKDLWAQYNEGRLFIPNLAFVALGSLTRFNLKAIVMLGAAAYVASFFLLLACFRVYVQRRLSWIAILSLGLVWFSLADTGNALWAFQLAWYLVIFFFSLMMFFLIVWPARLVPRVSLAAAAAVLGSLSMLQGFLIWPVGALFLVWNRRLPWRRRAALLGGWVTAALVTLAVFLRDYVWSHGCTQYHSCDPGMVLNYPWHYIQFFAAMVGYVIPRLGPFGRAYVGLHEALGVLLLLGAVVVIVYSIRERATSERPPLAVALVVFALLFDLTIVIGRGLAALPFASQRRFTMPNIVLVAGLVVFAWSHVPRFIPTPDRRRRARRMLRPSTIAWGVLALFVVMQAVFTTASGIDEGRTWHSAQVTQARFLVNRDRLSDPEAGCYLRVFVTNGVGAGPLLEAWWNPLIDLAAADRLHVFEKPTYERYRRRGPPTHPDVCSLKSAMHSAWGA